MQTDFKVISKSYPVDIINITHKIQHPDYFNELLILISMHVHFRIQFPIVEPNYLAIERNSVFILKSVVHKYLLSEYFITYCIKNLWNIFNLNFPEIHYVCLFYNLS